MGNFKRFNKPKFGGRDSERHGSGDFSKFRERSLGRDSRSFDRDDSARHGRRFGPEMFEATCD